MARQKNYNIGQLINITDIKHLPPIKNELEKIDTKAYYTDVYHHIMEVGEIFGRLSPKIPRHLLLVVQRIHYRIAMAAEFAYAASNLKTKEDKMTHIYASKNELFYLYNQVEYLVKTKCLTVGEANLILQAARICFFELVH